MESNKRTLYFIVGTILVGLLLIGIMIIPKNTIADFANSKGSRGEKGDSIQIDTLRTTLEESHHKIQKDIDNLTVNSINPQVYNTLLQKISISESQGEFTEIIASNLKESLNEKYISLSFTKADGVFSKDPINKSELNSILNHISTLGASQNKIQSYNTRIKQIEYYIHTLPEKVRKFTNKSYADFSSSEYNSLKNELKTLPTLDSSLKNRASIVSAKKNSLNKLESYYSKYLEYELVMSGF